ncbi:uncharacterized protein BO95DRAFT_438920 [Aspergillus brunneoviolaceus CBS 621.78]|uniref:Uncharacterized protein n=1 Tax=Aspergillus brunneoviolaceus CBS 621.78 TaxID=1450534 RepID=A0ACD1GKB3_9EURO|nr:hypothetical protein BO95DRAFT_438920 [Aspergillus brunneoviolaceus CBS 621.78]RAH49706.1 hypothetical protein BO95DRAFT_438920 [Aspergillus brunneoviolaceus CBS 621.78]
MSDRSDDRAPQKGVKPSLPRGLSTEYSLPFPSFELTLGRIIISFAFLSSWMSSRVHKMRVC